MTILVTLENETAAFERVPERLTSVRQASFEIPGIRRLRLDTVTSSDDAGDYLSRQVARTPGDLRSHVQRINLSLAKGEGDDTYGAVLDLFIVLGHKGLPLRRRMLHSAKRLLTKEQHQALHRHLENGVRATDAMPCAGSSMLGKGITGTDQLVVNEAAAAAGQRDPLIESREYLEYGQLDEARDLLELAVLQEPWRSDLQTELLEIYRYTRDQQSFINMRERLEAMDVSISEAWQKPIS
jgi:hypothetical protein